MGFKNLPYNTKHQNQHSSISTSLMRLHPKPAAEPSTARLQEIPDIMASSSLTTNSTASQEEWMRLQHGKGQPSRKFSMSQQPAWQNKNYFKAWSCLPCPATLGCPSGEWLLAICPPAAGTVLLSTAAAPEPLPAASILQVMLLCSLSVCAGPRSLSHF